MDDISNEAARPAIRGAEWFLVWFAGMCFWWLLINALHLKDTTQNYVFGLVFGLIPLVGGLVGLRNSQKWGGIRSVMGRATGLLSLGLVFWSLGGLVWAYYNLFGAIEVPYPSLADVAYIVSWPLWTLGAIQLSRATGAQFSLRKLKGKILLFAAPLVAIAISYYLLVVVARGGTIDLSGGLVKTFFDLAYPVGDVVILTFALLIYGLSVDYFGGVYKKSILIMLAGFVVNYVADVMFAWTTTAGTFYVAGWVDFLYLTAMTMLAMGIAGLNPSLPRERS